jgi:DNA recombination protein RmuC
MSIELVAVLILMMYDESMSGEILLVLGVIVTGFVALYFLLKTTLQHNQSPAQLEQVVNQVFGLSASKIAEQSRQLLSSERETIHVDIENKRQAIEELVKQLQLDLKTRQDEIRTLEQDRTRKFSELTTQIEQHRKLTDELRISTQQLATVLSNNQQRGEWGERIIEDLLEANGLVEGVHYVKQTKLDGSALRPDITLLLPNERVVPVDVKFPYSEIQKMAVAETKPAREAHLKQFGVDLKSKITKVAEYINPEANTLDYAILFVPNEMIFSFINQRFPDLVDEAIAKRVLIVSPFTFLIVARTVIESYRNFMISDKLRDVVRYVDEFVKEWGVFKDKFAKYGRSLDTLKTDYEELTTTRVRQLERKIEKIETVRQGGLLEGKKKTAV